MTKEERESLERQLMSILWQIDCLEEKANSIRETLDEGRCESEVQP